MRTRGVPAIVVAVVLGLVLGGGAVAALQIPKHSVGWSKLSKGVQKRIQGSKAPVGIPGPVGPVGPVGPQGQPGIDGDTHVATYSAVMDKGDASRTLGVVGPLTFTASCSPSGNATKATVSATSSADEVWILGKTLDKDETAVIQELEFSGELRDFNVLNAMDVDQTFSIEGVPIIMVNTHGRDCRFFGTLVETGGDGTTAS